MMKIILYFIIISFIYNVLKNIKISSIYKKYSKPKTNHSNNFNNKNDDILDAEYEEI